MPKDRGIRGVDLMTKYVDADALEQMAFGKEHPEFYDGQDIADWYEDCIVNAPAALRECREREVGCEWCKHYEDLPEHFINGNPVGKVYDTSITQDEMGRWHIELPRDADIGIQFCPMCGRRLTEGSAE